MIWRETGPIQASRLAADLAKRQRLAAKQSPRGWPYQPVPLRRPGDRWYCRPRLYRDPTRVDRRLWLLMQRLVAGEAPSPLLLSGAVGTGKSRACLALSDLVAFGRYWTVSDVMDAMCDREPPWSWPRVVDLAVIDELGQSDPVSQFEYAAVKEACNWRESRPAVYVSNHPLPVLRELYDARIASRIGCGSIFNLDGPDRRQLGR